jgi:hypothetical protein
MKQDTFEKLKFHIFLQGLLFLKDLQGTRFKESHVVLKFKPLISVAYEHKKGGEKFLPKCGHIDVAKSKRMYDAPFQRVLSQRR